MGGVQRSPNTTTSEEYLKTIAGLVTVPFDYVLVSEKNSDGNPTEIVYKINGSTGTVVATLTITYDTDGDFESAEVS